MEKGHYHDLQFDADCLTARRSTGEQIRFTRPERALLRRFLQAPQRLRTRAQLLAALDTADEASERNIDYLVNRLRAKLGDDARHPRFIRTQYGEGYVWVAPSRETGSDAAFIAIGPLAPHAAESTPGSFLRALRDRLAARIAPERQVALFDAPPLQAAANGTAFLVDAGLHVEDDRLRGVLALRNGRTLRMLAALRIDTPGADAEAALEEAVEALRAAMWEDLAETAPGGAQGPSDEPAYVRVVSAERMLSTQPVGRMHESASRASHHQAQYGEQPRLLLERANLRMMQILFALGTDGMMASPAREAWQADIESLVMAALPGVQDDPVLMLTAAKLLVMMGPSQRGLARSIVDACDREGTAFAATMALRAQLLMYDGDIETALGLYDQCLAQVGMHDDFRLYLLFLKAYGLLALGRRTEVAELAAGCHAIRAETRDQLSPMLYASSIRDPGGEDLAGIAASSTPERMRARVAHAWHMAARRFDVQRHRVEFMRCIVANALAWQGPDAIPAEIRRQLPELFPS